MVDPTKAALVRTQIRSCEICGEQSGTVTSSLLVLRFHSSILIPRTAPQSLMIILSHSIRVTTDTSPILATDFNTGTIAVSL
jgi:hypothetical protein